MDIPIRKAWGNGLSQSMQTVVIVVLAMCYVRQINPSVTHLPPVTKESSYTRIRLRYFTQATISIRERKKMFYLTTHSTNFIYGYMASDIWLRTILIVRKETRCRHIGYCYLLTARVLLYAPSHRQDNTYHGLCYTSRGALAGTRNSSMVPPHEGSIRRSTSAFQLSNFHICFCTCVLSYTRKNP